MKTKHSKLIQFIGSGYCFVIILLIFLGSASWLAISSRYPMAFDEDYHLGLIELHTHEVTPWFRHQPAGAARYSTLTRDPSYLYHYLMSFPYRAIQALTHDQTILVISLRFINIALFGFGIWLLRRLLLKTRASPALINVSLLFFVLTPVTPLLAAHINYDNLQFVVLIGALLFTVDFARKLKTTHTFSFADLLGLLSLSLLGSLVKFTFLPFLTAIVLYIIYLLAKLAPRYRKNWRSNWQSTPKRQRTILVSIFILSLALFCNTYGVNLIRYHNPIPQCNQVLSIERCSAYPPWYRNYQAALHKQSVNPNPVTYSFQWVAGMFTRLLFTINGHGQLSDNENHIAPVMATTAVVITIGGVLLCIRYWKQIFQRDSMLVLLLFVTAVYTVSVWGRNYHDYLQLGKIVAINGRYFIPVLPFVYLTLALAYSKWLTKRSYQVGLLAITLVLFLQGGGAISFIHYSNSNWYWPDNSTANELNENAKRIINPLFISR